MILLRRTKKLNKYIIATDNDEDKLVIGKFAAETIAPNLSFSKDDNFNINDNAYLYDLAEL